MTVDPWSGSQSAIGPCRYYRAPWADLAARATPVTDREQRRRILSERSTEYRSQHAVSFDSALANSPRVELTFEGEAAWLNEGVRSAAT